MAGQAGDAPNMLPPLHTGRHVRQPLGRPRTQRHRIRRLGMPLDRFRRRRHPMHRGAFGVTARLTCLVYYRRSRPTVMRVLALPICDGTRPPGFAGISIECCFRYARVRSVATRDAGMEAGSPVPSTAAPSRPCATSADGVGLPTTYPACVRVGTCARARWRQRGHALARTADRRGAGSPHRAPASRRRRAR